MKNLNKLLASYQMILHEAVDSFDDKEYQELAALLPAAKDEYARIVSRIEALTPGGSEFSGDIRRCLDWIKGRIVSVGEVAAERNQLRDRLNNAEYFISDLFNTFPDWSIDHLSQTELFVARKECFWTRGTIDDIWTASCGGGVWVVYEGTPAENGMRFCPFCGLKLKETASQEQN